MHEIDLHWCPLYWLRPSCRPLSRRERGGECDVRHHTDQPAEAGLVEAGAGVFPRQDALERREFGVIALRNIDAEHLVQAADDVQKVEGVEIDVSVARSSRGSACADGNHEQQYRRHAEALGSEHGERAAKERWVQLDHRARK